MPNLSYMLKPIHEQDGEFGATGNAFKNAADRLLASFKRRAEPKCAQASESLHQAHRIQLAFLARSTFRASRRVPSRSAVDREVSQRT